MSWTVFFPFSRGDSVLVRSKLMPLGLKARGTAEVLTIDDRTLGLSYHLPEKHFMLGRIRLPETQGTLTLSYFGEGAGNKVVVTANGDTWEDGDVVIVSDPQAGAREIDPSKDIDGRNISLTLLRAGATALIPEVEGLPNGFDLSISFSSRA